MYSIKRSALVPYTQRQMFELVNCVEDYPRFLPWCHAVHVLSREADHVEATLDIVWSGIHKSFTTRDTLHPYEKIEIKLVTGPFKSLEGHWQFHALGDQGCKVVMELDFELSGSIFDRVFQPIFNHIANSFVEAFCKRAAEVYGLR